MGKTGKTFKTAAVFTKPVFRVDNSVKLEFDTREFGGEDAATLMDMRGGEGWLLFSANNDIAEKDIPDEKADSMTGQKSQAQRLRGSLFVLWEQRGRKGSFEDFYRSQMEVLIEFVKEKLE